MDIEVVGRRDACEVVTQNGCFGLANVAARSERKAIEILVFYLVKIDEHYALYAHARQRLGDYPAGTSASYHRNP
jgi:hypothetical protein